MRCPNEDSLVIRSKTWYGGEALNAEHDKFAASCGDLHLLSLLVLAYEKGDTKLPDQLSVMKPRR